MIARSEAKPSEAGIVAVVPRSRRDPLHQSPARLPRRIAKDPRFERIACEHKGTYADDCLVNRVTEVRAGEPRVRAACPLLC